MQSVDSDKVCADDFDTAEYSHIFITLTLSALANHFAPFVLLITKKCSALKKNGL